VQCTTTNLTVQLTDGVLVCYLVNFSVQFTQVLKVYRLWKIYTNSYRVIVLPVILWIGALVLTALQIYLQVVKVTLSRDWLPVNQDIGAGIILTPFWASTILLNLYATSEFCS
jgi:hypothetical protein